MTAKISRHLIAVDVGNSAVKLGRFRVSTDPEAQCEKVDLQLDGVYPTVISSKELATAGNPETYPKRLETLLLQLPAAAHCWYAVSVNRQTEARLASWIRHRRPQDDYVLLSHTHFPQKIDVRYPERVGTDRLAAAVAVNELRAPARAAIMVDAGTAVTVDVITRDGVFRGGAILPGMETAAAALANATDALPLVDICELSSSPPPIGRSTEEAIRSGLVWGCVGAVRELIARISEELPEPPDVYCTGGEGLLLAQLLGQQLKFDPNLVLRGIAMTGFRHQLSGLK
jgi:type III pantothenate kinase